MDPDTALANARAAAFRAETTTDAEDREAAALEVVVAFRALDDWLSEGGYRPQPWQRADRIKARDAQRLEDGGYAKPL